MQADAADRGAPRVVAVVREGIEPIAVRPLCHAIRSRAQRCGVVGEVIEVRICREQVSRKNRIVAVAAEKRRDDRRVRLLERDDGGVRVWNVDRGNAVVPVAGRNRIRWIHNRTIRERDVART